MIYEDISSTSRARRTLSGAARLLLELRVDGPPRGGPSLIAAYGLVVLYSASGQSAATVLRTVARLLLGTVVMLLLARVNPNFLSRSAPWLYAAGCLLLVLVALIGRSGLGAQRWLDPGLFRFPPPALMERGAPMVGAL